MPARADLEIAEGNIRSPLHGVPIAYKDLLATNAIKTTSGTSVYADHVPDYDATVVSRLAAAGTVMLGKLKLTEGAFSRHHPTVEIPQNPWGRTFGRACHLPDLVLQPLRDFVSAASALTRAVVYAFPHPQMALWV